MSLQSSRVAKRDPPYKIRISVEPLHRIAYQDLSSSVSTMSESYNESCTSRPDLPVSVGDGLLPLLRNTFDNERAAKI